ncbi:MAG: low affinity iron permease family protein [Chloroflexota bacterium]
MSLGELFSRFAKWSARATGSPAAFLIAFLIIVVWGITGPIFRFSDTWQLVINTGTTIVTFLMVFLIQSTQNRDSEAVQIKLDELIRAIKGAQNSLISIEDLTEDELDQLRERYARLAADAGTRSKAPQKVGEVMEGEGGEIEQQGRALARKGDALEKEGRELRRNAGAKSNGRGKAA